MLDRFSCMVIKLGRPTTEKQITEEEVTIVIKKRETEQEQILFVVFSLLTENKLSSN